MKLIDFGIAAPDARRGPRDPRPRRATWRRSSSTAASSDRRRTSSRWRSSPRRGTGRRRSAPDARGVRGGGAREAPTTERLRSASHPGRRAHRAPSARSGRTGNRASELRALASRVPAGRGHRGHRLPLGERVRALRENAHEAPPPSLRGADGPEDGGPDEHADVCRERVRASAGHGPPGAPSTRKIEVEDDAHASRAPSCLRARARARASTRSRRAPIATPINAITPAPPKRTGAVVAAVAVALLGGFAFYESPSRPGLHLCRRRARRP